MLNRKKKRHSLTYGLRLSGLQGAYTPLVLGLLNTLQHDHFFYFSLQENTGVLYNKKRAKKNHRARVLGEFDVILNAGSGEPLLQPGQLLGGPTRPLLLSLRALLRVVQHLRLHPAKIHKLAKLQGFYRMRDPQTIFLRA